ncbi:MAG: ABC transporter substrate-binding protein [Burkholderiaceae bacterium]|jgi:branched-chain amino acid transport system substrate-binding protein|nr:ABC transporter substrate-binding protein [Burkholderiaceae bacterium]
MIQTRRIVIAAVVATAASLAAAGAFAQSKPIRIGVMNDQSSVYADFQGPGSVLAAKMAVEDYGGKAAGRAVEVVSADHQNKPDVGSAIARRWIDEDGVNMIADLPNSAVAFAVSDVVRDRNKVMVGSGAGSAELTGSKCSPNTVHWTYDTWSYGHSLARAVMQRGGKSWFFVTADYAFGHDLEKQASEEVKSGGGLVLGAVRAPIGTMDYSSFLISAQSSGAGVVALAVAGGDTTTSMKQAAEFGLPAKQTIAPLIFGINNVPALGLAAAKGALLVNPFYWDMNDGTRKWSREFRKRAHNHAMPNDMQAGVYAGVLHYLKAVDKVGNAEDGKAIVAAMKAMPTDDPLFGRGRIREDGRKLHPMYLLQVKSPEESKEEWDYFKTLASVPADQAFRPMSEGKCPLVANK